MNGFAAALRCEVYAGLNTLGSKLVILLPATLVLLQFAFNRLIAAGSQARDNLMGRGGFDAALSEHAYGYLVDGLGTGLTLLGLLLVAQAAYSFSHDRDTGALRHVIIRRASRPAVVLAKLVYLHLLAAVAVALLLLASYLASGWLWEFGAVVEDGFELISEEEIRREIGLGLRLALIPLPAAIGFGLLVSVSANTATQALAAALGGTLALDLFKGLLGENALLLYARFQPSLLDQSYLASVSRLVRGYSDVLVDERLLQFNTWVPLPTLLLFVFVTLWIVRRRKL
ncbi:MAG: hypothetical protein WD396_03340 [Pseudohongiellaceae bacterium]